MISPVEAFVVGGLAIAVLTAGLVAVARTIVRISALGAIAIGALLAPVLWICWGASFLFTGTPSSDHDESQVYLGVSIFLALITFPLTLATSFVTVRLLERG